MDDQPDVGLVDSHAESVGGADDPDAAVEELPLGLQLSLWAHPGVEVSRRNPVHVQVLCGLLGPPPAGPIDYGAAAVAAQVLLQQLRNLDHLQLRLGGQHVKVQVLAAGAAVQQLHLHVQLVPEVISYLVLDVWLGGGGQAEHRRSLAAQVLSDEPGDVAVVGAEVVPPLGQAVRLVQHPAGDEPLLQGLFHGWGPQLLRRDDRQRRLAAHDAV